MAREYTSDHITGFTRDLEKIQAKPTLYIGPTDSAGVFTLLRECLDNAVDEARAGRNDKIQVIIEGLQGPFYVLDAGVGIPVAQHKKMKISTLTHVLTNLQSSGKMKVGGAYKSAVGTHGVGIKATNALSSEFEVWTYRDNKAQKEKGWYYTKFLKGIEKQKVTSVKKPIKFGSNTPKKGTLVKFTPDSAVFGKHKLDVKAVQHWAQMTAYMNSGLSISITANGKTKEYKSKDGIKAYLKDRIEKLNANPASKKFITHTSDTLEMALAVTDVEGPQVEFFTNTVRNLEEGVHADDVYKALYDSLKPHAKLVAGKLPFTPTDLRDGLLGIVNYKIDAPQFDSQTKEKLVDQRVKGACYDEALKVFAKFWSENKSFAKEVVNRAAELRKKTADFLKDKKLVKSVNAAKKTMSLKLAGVTGNAPVDKRELFLVEGDSAGGNAKLARDKTFQAIYPLRGKPLNVMEAAKDKVNNNAEVVGLLAAIGIDMDGKKKDTGISYGKIIALADPDVDGKHINTLIMAVFWRFMPSLFAKGHIYIVKAPLYKTRHKGKVYFGMTKEDLYKQAGTDKCVATYIKGWGEVSKDDMWVALDPKYRKLYKVESPDRKQAKEFEAMLGKDASYRKQLLGVE